MNLYFIPEHLDITHFFPGLSEDEKENFIILENDFVRVAGSFDMGWSTRGNGRSYNSLCGTAAIIGFFTKKVISYVTFNRKCYKCSRGQPKNSHYCRQNYVGSAKGMEPMAAMQLVSDNEIFVGARIELGIFIGDNDSTATHRARSSVSYNTVKQAGKNHTTKGVTNALYKLARKYKKLNSNAIKYLKRCFSYSLA